MPTEAKKTRKRCPTPDEALTRYLALGPGRSLKDVLVALKDHETLRAPAYETVKRWSSTEKWAVRAQEHDVQAAAEARVLVCEAQAIAQLAGADQLEFVTGKVLERIVDLLPSVEDSQRIQELANVVEKLVEARQKVLGVDGGPGARMAFGDPQKADSEATEQLMAITGNGNRQTLQ